MTRTPESSPRTGTEQGAPAASSASLLDDWDHLFDGEDGVAVPAPPVVEQPEASRATRYLGFRIGSQLYAVPLADLSEVVRAVEITPVPRLRPFVRGIVSVRGTIVPIVDLRRRLSQGAEPGVRSEAGNQETGVPVRSEEASDETLPDGGTAGGSLRRILITSIGGESFGLLVDEVTHPFALEPLEVEPPPVTLPRRLQDLVLGIGRVDDRIHILLDLSVVLRFDAVLPLRSRGEGTHD